MRAVVWICLAALIAACGGSTQEPRQCIVTRVTVTPSPATVQVGSSVVFSADVVQHDCSNLTTTWTTGNPAIASVASAGVITGLVAGTTTVHAAVGGVSGSATLTVTAVPCQVLSVTVTPAVNNLVPTEVIPLSAAIVQQFCTNLTTVWGSSAPTVASVSSTGVVTAHAAGSATITAQAGGASGTATVSVAAPGFGSTWNASRLRIAGTGEAPVGYASAAWAASPTDLFVASGDALYRYNGSTWTRTFTVGAGVWAMWGSGPNDVFAVGPRLVHWNGAAWSQQPVPGNQHMKAAWGSGPGSVLAVGSGGAILRYDGTTWTAMASPTAETLVGISGSGPGFALAVSDQGQVLKFDGSAWTVQARPGPLLSAIWVWSPTLAYAVGEGLLYKFDGVAWAPLLTVSTLNLTAIWGSAPDDLYIAGAAGYAVHFDGTTFNWPGIPPKVGTDFTALTGAGAGVYGVGDGFAVSLTPAAMTLVSYVPNLNSVWAVNANTAFAVGDGGTVWKYSNGSWQLQNTGVQYNLNDVWAGSATEVVAVGTRQNGNVFRRDYTGAALRYDGTTWTEMPLPVINPLVSAWGPQLDALVAVAPSTPVFRFEGTTWNQLFTGPVGQVVASWGSGPTRDNIFVGYDGYTARLDITNTLRTLASAPTHDALISLWGNDPTNYFAGSNNGLIYRFSGVDWTTMSVPTTSPVTGIWAFLGNEVFALTSIGEVNKWDGISWRRVKLPEPGLTFSALSGSATRLFAVGPNGAVMVTP